MPKTTRKRKPNPASAGGLPSAGLMRELEGLGAELLSRSGPKGLLAALSSRLVKSYGASVSAVWLADSTGKALQLGASAGRVKLPAALSKGVVQDAFLKRTVQEGRPQLLLRKLDSRHEVGRWARQHKLQFVAAYPLQHDSKSQGVLMVGSAKPPGKDLLALYHLQAKLASITLHDAELLNSTRRTVNRLSILVEASKALNSTLDLSELLGRILDVAQSHTEAERGTLFLVDEKSAEIWSLIAHGLEKQEIRLPIGKGIAGHVAKTGEIVNIPDAYADPRFNPDVDKRTGYRTRNILCLPIRNKTGKIIATLQLLNKKVGTFSDDDADFLLTLSGHMALALENAQLHQQLLDKERMEKELALARGIQRSLLPETAPLVEGFDIAVLNEPCYAVGGDYYDFLTLGPRTLLVVIADVEGKGVGSALVMSNLQATLRALVLHLHSLNEIAESLNRMIWNDTRAEKYLSLFLGLIDVKRRALHYINCGHVPPVIVRPKQDPISLTEGGMVIGLFENPPYARGQEKFQAGDVLVLCTDGITESMNARHEEYGSERLTERIQESAGQKAADIVESVSTDVARFSRQGTHIDDKVMIVIKVA